MGIEAVTSMQKLVDIIASNRDNGGRNRHCCSLLQTIIMTMMNNDANEGKGIRIVIMRQILGSLSHGSASGLMIKAGKKRQSFEEEDIRNYKDVEMEEQHWKYSVDEITVLQAYMRKKLYTRKKEVTQCEGESEEERYFW